MKSVYCYFHAGSANHGCEAIVRSTASLLHQKPLLISDHPDQDRTYGINEIAEIRNKLSFIPTFPEKVGCFITTRFLHSEKYGYDRRSNSEVKGYEPGAIAMSIGGDNYCYGEAYNIYLAAINRQLHKRGLKTVLWGCSIEPSMVTEEMRKDFSRYDLIVSRESISYKLLKFCNPHTLLACDPAFTLEMRETELPKEFIPGRTVGINLSPIIQKREKTSGITIQNYRTMIDYILKETDYNIALIPHVVISDNDDRNAMAPLYQEYQNTGRVCMIADQDCRQLKWIISQCCLFIGARTHATIAAYSSGVPTLVIGYSTKANGIARDLFGQEEHYVLPVQSLADADDMTRAFAWLNENRDDISRHLRSCMPGYCRSVTGAAELVEKL